MKVVLSLSYSWLLFLFGVVIVSLVPYFGQGIAIVSIICMASAIVLQYLENKHTPEEPKLNRNEKEELIGNLAKTGFRMYDNYKKNKEKK